MFILSSQTHEIANESPTGWRCVTLRFFFGRRMASDFILEPRTLGLFSRAGRFEKRSDGCCSFLLFLLGLHGDEIVSTARDGVLFLSCTHS
ncbi:hypothetical protein BDW60DRAFT_159891 [Aspergillus nidulans var. acristatus]|jgi:hypothetical protein